MAHIPDGVVSVPVLIAGGLVTVAGCAQALRRLSPEAIPQVSLLSAVFFVAALIHIPIGPSSVHLLLTGLTGVVLGWSAFPAILVALLLQTVLFGFGGFAVLGVNVMNMAVPAVLCGLLFAGLRRWFGDQPRLLVPAAGVCGALGVLLTALAVASSLALSGREFGAAAAVVVVGHVPVMVVEGLFTAAVVAFLLRVKPDVLAVAGGGVR